MEWNSVFLTGKAEEIITPKNMKDTYGIEVKVIKNSFENLTLNSCIPIIRKS